MRSPSTGGTPRRANLNTCMIGFTFSANLMGSRLFSVQYALSFIGYTAIASESAGVQLTGLVTTKAHIDILTRVC